MDLLMLYQKPDIISTFDHIVQKQVETLTGNTKGIPPLTALLPSRTAFLYNYILVYIDKSEHVFVVLTHLTRVALCH